MPEPAMRAESLMLSLLLGLSGLSFAASEPVIELEEGVAAIARGEHQTGLTLLATAERALADQPTRRQERARANLFMGVAYADLGEEALAKARFLRALELDPELLTRHAGAIGKLTTRVREALSGVARDHEQSLVTRKAAKQRSWTGLVLLGGGGAAAGAGIAVARKPMVVVEQETVLAPERENQPPQVTIKVEPAGASLACVTALTFTAVVNDPDNEPLSIRWDFGDGVTARGQSVVHKYLSHGEKRVTLEASDGLTTVNSTASVLVKSLEGLWRVEGVSSYGITAVEISSVVCEPDAPVARFLVATWAGTSRRTGSPYNVGYATAPGHVDFNVQPPCKDRPSCWRVCYFVGDFDAGLDRFAGTADTNWPPTERADALTFVRE